MANNRVFTIISKHINTWDAWGLLECGAPEDEYGLESKRIANDMTQIKNETELAKKIKDVFDKSFGEKHEFERCYEVAVQIWDELREES